MERQLQPSSDALSRRGRLLIQQDEHIGAVLEEAAGEQLPAPAKRTVQLAVPIGELVSIGTQSKLHQIAAQRARRFIAKDIFVPSRASVSC